MVLTFREPLCAQWKALGPFGGPAAVVQVDPYASRTVIAGTRNGHLFRSRDLGETWEPLPFPPQARAVLHTLIIDPHVPNRYLAGISTDLPGSSGMLRSADGGSTWQPVPMFRTVQVRAIAIFRGNSQLIAAGTDIGIFRSDDGGTTWQRISPEENRELQPVVSLVFDPKDGNIIYAGTPHLPWKTSDGGITWRSIHTGMMDDSDVFSMVVDRNRPQRVLVGACSGLYRSLTGGLAWTRLTGAREASYRTYTIVQDPQYENVLFAGTTHGMIRSLDGGTSWERIGSYATRSIAFDLRHLGRIFIATDQAGILRSENNGNTWQQANRGFCNRHLTTLAAGDRGALYTSTIYDAAEGGIFRLANGADEWSKVASDPRVFGEPLLTIVPSRGSRARLYAATSNWVVFSRDAGRTWTRLSMPVRGSLLTDLFSPPWASNGILAVADSKLFLSRDSGRTWKKLRLPASAHIRSIAALDPPWMAAFGASDVYLSNDGETWNSGGRLPAGVEIHGIVSLPGRGLLAATSAGLRVSTHSGSWQTFGGPLEGNTIQAICRHPARLSVLFAAYYGVIYMSPDGGHSWVRISPESWPVGSVKQLLVIPGMPDRLFVLTQQQGVFVLPLEKGMDEHTASNAEPRALRP